LLLLVGGAQGENEGERGEESPWAMHGTHLYSLNGGRGGGGGGGLSRPSRQPPPRPSLLPPSMSPPPPDSAAFVSCERRAINVSGGDD